LIGFPTLRRGKLVTLLEHPQPRVEDGEVVVQRFLRPVERGVHKARPFRIGHLPQGSGGNRDWHL
jgi:hypothetical protein